MLIYIAIFLFIAYLAILYELAPFDPTLLMFFCFLLLALFAGLRGPNVGRDYYGYLYSFDYTDQYDISSSSGLLSFYEPGFLFIVKLAKSIFTINYGMAIMLFFAFASVGLKTFSIPKLSFNPFLVLLFYYTNFFLLHEMTQIRVGLASAIFFIAVPFYLQKKFFTYSLLIVVATFFHYSAILYFFLFFFDAKKLNRRFLILFLLSSIIVGFLKLPFLNYLQLDTLFEVSEKLNNYKDTAQAGYIDKINVFNVLFLINFFVTIGLLLFYTPKEKDKDAGFILFIKCNVFSIFLLAFLSGIPTIAYRLSELFGVASMFVIPYFSFLFPNRLTGTIATILLAAVFLYINVFHLELVKAYYITRL
jgi:hypothetical protein